ncbi:MAG: TIGR01777 family oxidoreductase [Porticoccaceae bacterium]
MKTILVTGGSGFIGRNLCDRLASLVEEQDLEVIVLSRSPIEAAKVLPISVRVITDLTELCQSVDILINLAGEPIADRRWSDKRKAIIAQSRIQTTQALYEYFSGVNKPPSIVISGSAVGFYGGGLANNQKVTEEARVEPNFSSQLCAAWEDTAQQFERLGSRVCLLRTGIVVGKQGALSKLMPAFKLGLGGPIASGQQWMPWVHIEDMVEIIMFAIENDISGPINCTAPQPVTNREFAKTLGKVLKRPAITPMPAVVVKLLFGQMGDELMIQGQSVIPQKLQRQGYQFKYSDLNTALRQLLMKER